MAINAVNFFLKHPHLDLHHALSVRRFRYLNAYKSITFDEAIVELEPDDIHHNYVIRLEKIFQEGFACLEKYRANEIDRLSEGQKDSLKCLENFFEDKDYHLECLVPFMSRPKANGTDKFSNAEKYTYLLAEHLFAPLTPGSCYMSDKVGFPSLLRECPGGCYTKHPYMDRNIERKPTGIGHPDVWHGFAGIILETGVSVVVRNENSSNTPEIEEPETFGEVSDEGLSRKQECVNNSAVLRTDKIISQSASQTIVNGLVNKDKCLFIPTLCASFGSVKIYMYDPVHDIFLMTPTDCALEMLDFDSKTFLSDVNIIYLWMVLNYNVFSKQSDKIIEDIESNHLHSGFPIFAENKYGIYREHLQHEVSTFPLKGTSPPAVMHIFLG